jgi:uncharacterized RDD family membrane protein YckC
MLDLTERVRTLSGMMEHENQNNEASGITPSNDVIEPQVAIVAVDAEVGTRVAAYVIDVLIAIVASMLIGMVSSKLANVVVLGYLLTRDALPFLDGQSIGKKAMKIRAVTEDGRSLSGNWNPGLVRNAVMLIPFFPLVELVILLTGKGKPNENRRLGDQWAKTKVIKAP